MLRDSLLRGKLTYLADEPNRRCPDIPKAATQLSYASRIGLDEDLKRFFGWAGESYK